LKRDERVNTVADVTTQAARWLHEAWETGNPLAPFPEEMAPADIPAGEAIAAALVEELGIPVTGVRLAPAPGDSWVSAPLLEPRMLRAGTTIALSGLRHIRLSAGILGVLAEDLTDAPPVFSALHPVLDIGAERYQQGAPDAAHRVADLGGLGHVLVGKRFTGPLPEVVSVRIGPTGTRPRPFDVKLAPLMEQLAADARRWGPLPAGAVLVVAGLALGRVPNPGEKWSAAVSPVGRITVQFA
jgi:hypothetical protein